MHFWGVQLHAILHNNESFSDVLYMIILLGGLHEHIVNIHRHIFVDLGFEYPVYQPLIGSYCIIEAEGHYSVVVGARFYYEGSLLLVLLTPSEFGYKRKRCP